MKLYYRNGAYRIAGWNQVTQRLELISSHETYEEAIECFGVEDEPEERELEPETDDDDEDLLDFLSA